MKKVLVTGGCGFIGSWCCQYYRQKGWQAIAFDNMTKHELVRTGYNVEKARDYNLCMLQEIGVEVVVEDVRSKEAVFEYAKDCDFIIHTAAQPAMTISMEEPALDFSTNVMGTLNVLEAAKQFDLPMVNCATIHVYGNNINQQLEETKTRFVCNPVSIDEDYPILTGTLTPLHASKAAADIYTKVYADAYKCKVASFRLTGLYGERQFGGEDHGWVANFSIKAISGMPLTIYGNGKQLRDILYAHDLIRAFDCFYNNPVPGIYNIGGDRNNMISLLECIDVIADILGRKPQVQFGPERLGDLKYFVCNTTKAGKILHWQPSFTPREGIERLIGWVQEHKEIFQQG